MCIRDRFRYQRLAEETATSVLREEMATLDSVGFYSTERRLAATTKTVEEPEKQLTPIQLNEQNKLLDAASQKLAGVQQNLDIYVQGTAAQVAARTQDWVK